MFPKNSHARGVNWIENRRTVGAKSQSKNQVQLKAEEKGESMAKETKKPDHQGHWVVRNQAMEATEGFQAWVRWSITLSSRVEDILKVEAENMARLKRTSICNSGIFIIQNIYKVRKYGQGR